MFNNIAIVIFKQYSDTNECNFTKQHNREHFVNISWILKFKISNIENDGSLIHANIANLIQ